MRGSLVCVLVGLFAVLSPLTSAASAQNDREYKNLIKQGVSEFKLGNWEEARTLFTKAHEVNPNARTFRGLGMVEFELRHYVKAAQLLEAAIKDERNPLTKKQQKEVDKLLTRARTFVSLYQINMKPEAATIALDGLPAKLEVQGWIMIDAGEHTLSASSPGYRDKTVKLDVRGGEGKTLLIELEPIANSSASAESSQFFKPPAEKKDEGGILTKWWFWTATGVVVTGIVVGVAIAASGEEVRQPTPGDDGIIIQASRRP